MQSQCTENTKAQGLKKNTTMLHREKLDSERETKSAKEQIHKQGWTKTTAAEKKCRCGAEMLPK